MTTTIQVTYLFRVNGVLVSQQWAYAPLDGQDLLIKGPYSAEHEGITWVRGLHGDQSPEVLAMRVMAELGNLW